MRHGRIARRAIRSFRAVPGGYRSAAGQHLHRDASTGARRRGDAARRAALLLVLVAAPAAAVGAALQGVVAPPRLPTALRCDNFRIEIRIHCSFWENNMSISTILLILLVLLLIGALPTWPYSGGWGYYPAGGLGLVVS